MKATILVGDCRARMAEMEANSIDAIVTDPPYGLEFMGKEWDSFAPQRTTARVQRTGAAGFGKQKFRSGTLGVRTTFKCRSCGGWSGTFSDARRRRQRPCQCPQPDLDYYGPPPALVAFGAWSTEWAVEALRVAKPGAHLLAFGGTRTIHRLICAIEDAGWEVRDMLCFLHGQGFPKSKNLGNGFGTALKPAWEGICLARKPIAAQNITANVLAHGTGALNVDACRIGTDERPHVVSDRRLEHNTYGPGLGGSAAAGSTSLGRWPANVCLDEEAAAALDEASGESASFATMRGERRGAIYGGGAGPSGPDTLRGHGDSGGASRFFYTAKASAADRNDGLKDGERSTHPTVKPFDLMRWLVRLVTPPGGTVLDPFTGSGSTGVAALAESFNFIGIEISPEYAAIAERRIANVAPLLAQVEAEKPEPKPDAQLNLDITGSP